MRTILVYACAALLASCATSEKQAADPKGAVENGYIVVATLSTDSCSGAVAPYQTRTAVAVRKAVRRVSRGDMTEAEGAALASKAQWVERESEAIVKMCKQGRKDDEKRYTEHLASLVKTIEGMITEAK